MIAERLGTAAMNDVSNCPAMRGYAAVQPGSDVRAGSFDAVDADTVLELANLVLVMFGSLEQLRRQPLDEHGQRQLARAEWSVRQAAQLTRRVRSQAQGEDGKLEVVDLNAVVCEWAATTGQNVGGGMLLRTKFAPGRLPVHLDTGLLAFVLTNLVRDAAGVMPDGGMVTLRTHGPRLDGLGDQLAMEVSVSHKRTSVPTVVDVSATAGPHDRNTELSLWMAERFASTHDGTFSIETTPEHVTTVRLSLPYAGDAEPS